MMQMIKRALIGVVLLLGGACTMTSVTPSASVTTLQPVWPQYFKVDWTVEPGVTGARRITGYVYNTFGLPADDVQILAQALDASGAVIGQRLAWAPGWIPAYNRAVFRVDDLPTATSYSVSVWNIQFRDIDNH
jgi:hypothetical protein